MAFKDRLKLLRANMGITAAQLAVKLGKGESAVRMWEIGRSKPDVDTLICLSNILNCSVDYLLGLTVCKNDADRLRLMQFEKTLQALENATGIRAEDILCPENIPQWKSEIIRCLHDLNEAGHQKVLDYIRDIVLIYNST